MVSIAREDTLIKKIKDGDTACLDDLVRLFYPDILRYCIWHTDNQQNAEDATQETFIKAVKHLDGYVHRGKFRAFLYKIAANVCVDLWRRKATEALPETMPYIERGFEESESGLDFDKMLGSLSTQQQEVVILRFAHDLKIREIAEVLDEPMRTVQTRLRTALKKLEKEMKGEKPHA